MMTKKIEKFKNFQHQSGTSMFTTTFVSFAMIGSALAMLEVLL
jgi:hypothetical protein